MLSEILGRSIQLEESRGVKSRGEGGPGRGEGMVHRLAGRGTAGEPVSYLGCWRAGGVVVKLALIPLGVVVRYSYSSAGQHTWPFDVILRSSSRRAAGCGAAGATAASCIVHTV